MYKPSSPSSDNICILCCNVTTESRRIFDRQSVVLKIAEILCLHFWFTSDELDESKKICLKCWDKTSSFHQFYETVREAYLHQNESQRKIQDNVQHEDWQSDNNDNDVTMGSDRSDEERDECDNGTVQSKEEPTDNVKAVKITQPIDPAINDNEDAKQTSEPKDSIISSDEDAERDSEKLKQSTNDRDIESRVAEYFKMNCYLCGEHLGSLDKVTAHFSKKHQLERGYLVCCCKKKVKVRKAVIEHVQWHMNPIMFRCEICSKTLIDKQGLRQHMAKHHTQDGGPIDCHFCKKQFSNHLLLTAHSATAHPPDGQKFTCDICQKTFKLKKILEAHIKYKHSGTNQQYICDICAKVLSTKQNLKEHSLTHVDIPRMQCNICGASLKNSISLRIHMKIHADTKKTCDICFEVKANQMSLSNHKRRVHGPANHKCNFCEKSFTRSSSLREHIATHTGQSLYTCKYCPQTFKSDANMYKHMKQVHAEQWANDRKKR